MISRQRVKIVLIDNYCIKMIYDLLCLHFISLKGIQMAVQDAMNEYMNLLLQDLPYFCLLPKHLNLCDILYPTVPNIADPNNLCLHHLCVPKNSKYLGVGY